MARSCRDKRNVETWSAARRTKSMLSSRVKNGAIRYCTELLKNQGSESPNFSLSLGDKRNVETWRAARRTKSMLSSRVKNRAIRHCTELLKNQGSESPNFSLSLGDKRHVETWIAARRTKSMLSSRVKIGATRHCTELLKNQFQNRQTLACPWETSEMLKHELLPDARNRCWTAESKTETSGTVRSCSRTRFRIAKL